jgi:SAM-dependent methyltransferase
MAPSKGRIRDALPIDDDVVTRQDVEFHRATAHDYDKDITSTYRIYHEVDLLPVLDALGSDPIAALDIGCGTGAVALELAARGHRTLGLDHSPDMLEIAQGRARRLGVEEALELRKADVRKLPIGDGEIDFASCQGVLHHLPSPEACLAEMARVLRPGGIFFISEPCEPASPAVRLWEALLQAAIRVRAWIRRRPARQEDGLAPGEAPISARGLLAELDALGLEYDARFISHFHLLERLLPDRARLAVTRLVSAPWRRRKGNLIVVTGRKPQVA